MVFHSGFGLPLIFRPIEMQAPPAVGGYEIIVITPALSQQMVQSETWHEPTAVLILISSEWLFFLLNKNATGLPITKMYRK
jgi:hypothetical protein